MQTLPQTSNDTQECVRVGIYIRVSTEIQAVKGISTEEQEMRLRAGVARRPHWVVTQVYKDDGYSGHDMNRPDVQRCLTDVVAGKLDKVLALDVDRAHRNEQNRRNFEQYLTEHGVDMLYELEPEYDRLSMKNFSRGMKGLMAEYYSDWASETTRDKMIYMAKYLKRRTGGPVPFGLAIQTKQYARDPQWFPTLLEIFQRRARGESVRSIARWLSNTGVPTPGLLEWQRKPLSDREQPKRKPGSAWTQYTVERILRNETYHGTLVYNREFGKRFKFTAKGAEEHIRVEDAWEKFIDDDLWYKVRVIDSEQSTPRESTQAAGQFALTNVVCRRCGHSMHGYTSSKYKALKNEKRTYHYRLYRCTGRSNSGVCDAPMIRAEHLEHLVIDAVCTHIAAHQDWIERLYAQSLQTLMRYHQNLEQAIAKTTEEIQSASQERGKLILAIAGTVGQVSDVTIRQLDTEVLKRSEAIKEAEAKRQLVHTELQKLPSVKLRLQAMKTQFSQVAEQIRQADLAEQRRLLNNLTSYIEVDPDTRKAQVYIKQFLFAEADISLRLADDDFS